jgi:flavin reductase (DIM6/NTAB) family NADH-FMN oxidoreductase RutF
VTSAAVREPEATGPTVDHDGGCRDLFRKMTAGVAVITTSGPQGPLGMTASAVLSLSLRPPLIIACLTQGSGTLQAVRRSGVFGLHLLRDDQQHIAESFARPCGGDEKFAAVRAHTQISPLTAGVPTLPDALAWATCEVQRVIDGGDHRLLIGRVVDSRVGAGNPLVWHHSNYWQISDPVDLCRSA